MSGAVPVDGQGGIFGRLGVIDCGSPRSVRRPVMSRASMPPAPVTSHRVTVQVRRAARGASAGVAAPTTPGCRRTTRWWPSVRR